MTNFFQSDTKGSAFPGCAGMSTRKRFWKTHHLTRVGMDQPTSGGDLARRRAAPRHLCGAVIDLWRDGVRVMPGSAEARDGKRRHAQRPRFQTSRRVRRAMRSRSSGRG